MNLQRENFLTEFPTLVVCGANWGDEGKGKVIDLIMGEYDVVVRYSGGANAGHTVYTNEGKKLVSHLIPCGLAQNKICVLSRGEFFNAELFINELADAKKVLGSSLPPIYVDEQAPLWTPYHRLFEMYIEIMRGVSKIGTTNKGIGPLEGLYKLRLAPVVGHLFNQKLLLQVLETLHKVLASCFDFIKANGHLTEPVPEPAEVLSQLLSQASLVKEYVADTSYLLNEYLQKGKRILFEGAQATGLDAWWGTYPFVSSGNSVASGAALGTGLPMQSFLATILVAKTLPTRVGNGPMPSEMWDRQKAMDFARDNADLFSQTDERARFLATYLEKINSGTATRAEISQYFQVLGDERGATTGRGRSLGFLDLHWLSYAIRINRPKYLSLTRFDMLSGIKSIPVVVGYKYRGEVLPYGKLPPAWEMQNVETVMEAWECWPENILGYDAEKKLPQSAQGFLKRMEERLKVPILIVGTGPKREAVVVRKF